MIYQRRYKGVLAGSGMVVLSFSMPALAQPSDVVIDVAQIVAPAPVALGATAALELMPRLLVDEGSDSGLVTGSVRNSTAKVALKVERTFGFPLERPVSSATRETSPVLKIRKVGKRKIKRNWNIGAFR